jgi:hypothetical protein
MPRTHMSKSGKVSGQESFDKDWNGRLTMIVIVTWQDMNVQNWWLKKNQLLYIENSTPVIKDKLHHYPSQMWYIPARIYEGWHM